MSMVGVAGETGVPRCFADPKLYDPKTPECAGGMDPNYVGPEGHHIRKQCSVFMACGARVQAAKMGQQSQVIPVQNLMRPTAIAQPPRPGPQPVVPQPNAGMTVSQMLSTAAQTFAQANNRPVAQVVQPQAAQPAQVHPVYQVPQGYQYQPPSPAPYLYAAPTYQINHMAPPFLSTPEYRTAGDSFWTVLAREVFRSAFKGMLMSGAHYFDANPIRVPGPPPSQR